MSVFSQSFSPCGRFLAAGNNYGEIAVFSLSAALSPDSTALNQKPVLTFTGESSAGWRGHHRRTCWCLHLSSLEIPEINSMTINSRDNSLVVGGGDNNIHVMDLENGVFKTVLQGHSDYVHCVTVREREAEILSGGEDGAVRVWDSRTGQCVHCIEVYKYEVCARPQYGKWISCVTTDSDWMLCGGGPSLSLWHLRSLSPTSIFNLSGCQRQAAFHQDLILTVGEGAFVSHCLLGGEVKAQIPCTPQSLNTLQLNNNSTEHRVLTVGGSSDHIDVFTNLSYRAFSLRF
uniref:THO complex 6 n=1 Tax=Oreochromis niloticus TaxID=8128 RepID=A0A669D4G4_ORENI